MMKQEIAAGIRNANLDAVHVVLIDGYRFSGRRGWCERLRDQAQRGGFVASRVRPQAEALDDPAWQRLPGEAFWTQVTGLIA